MVDVDSEYSGTVIDRLTGSRRGGLVEMKDSHEGKVGGDHWRPVLDRSTRPMGTAPRRRSRRLLEYFVD